MGTNVGAMTETDLLIAQQKAASAKDNSPRHAGAQLMKWETEWEYPKTFLDIRKRGTEGWEYRGLDQNGNYIFQRPIPEDGRAVRAREAAIREECAAIAFAAAAYKRAHPDDQTVHELTATDIGNSIRALNRLVEKPGSDMIALADAELVVENNFGESVAHETIMQLRALAKERAHG